MTNHAGFGALTGALPSGRVKGKPFSSGITPVEGRAANLPSCLRFIGELDQTNHMVNGQALNLKFTPPPTGDEEKRAAFIDTFGGYLNAYFQEYKGLQVQCNIIGRSQLWEMHKDPSKCPSDFFVRVSGYTAYFKDLNPHMQREIILRAEYDIGSGQEVWDGWDHAVIDPGAGISGNSRSPLFSTGGSPTLETVVTWLLTDNAGLVLDGLLGWMQFRNLIPPFRRLVGDFEGTLLFRTRDDDVRKYVTFHNGHIKIQSHTNRRPNVSITFSDGHGLVSFLFSPVRDALNRIVRDRSINHPHTFDILTGILKNEITVDGNLNYLYRFGFLANHLLLDAFRAVGVG